MARQLTSILELERLRGHIRSGEDPELPTIVISAGTCGQASGANSIIRLTKRKIIEDDLHDQLRLRITGCHGFCQMEPMIVVHPEGTFYPRIKPEDVGRVIDATLAGETVEELLYRDPRSGAPIRLQGEIPFYRAQTRTIMADNEHVDPIRINDYIGHGGYTALGKVLARMDPPWVVEEVKRSGLRGRGGAGFPTGVKWEATRKQQNGAGKYIVCNADEGDPGAYMDRSLLEGNPHSIIEGMTIGGFAMGATRGFIYVRDEYPLAVKHVLIALRQARDHRLLGEDILGTGFSFEIDIVRGAGAFVCGEETALIRSIEGAMGEPRQRPPYPFERGIHGKPTCINNVESWANVPKIIELSAEKYASIGSSGNSGTKIFSLVGKVRNTGLVEVPMGTSLKKLVEEVGGGAPEGSRLKAVQTGGPSGGCIPVEGLDVPIDYDALAKAGSIMGSGGLIVMDEETCVVDVARYYLDFLKEESCGKCFTCRKGLQRMYELTEDIAEGRATLETIDLLEELAATVRDTTMCGLGQTAANPTLSTLRYFRDEYVEHIEQHRCRARVCKALIHYRIDPELCDGCMACLKPCPEGATSGEKDKVHVIDNDLCSRCGACLAACTRDAIFIEPGRAPDQQVKQ
jgi:NADH-quinone oxidoreductase subunit F